MDQMMTHVKWVVVLEGLAIDLPKVVPPFFRGSQTLCLPDQNGKKQSK
jgi:hypothetical protein